MMNARLEELRSKFQENPRRYFAPYANELRKAGDPAQAIAVCRAQLAGQPGHVSGHIVLGQALYEAGDANAAREIFTTALALDPENLIALRSLGEIAQVNGEFGAARQWYARLLDADPRNTEVAQLLRDIPTESISQPASAMAAAPAIAEPEPVPLPDGATREPEPEPTPSPSFHTSFTGSNRAYHPEEPKEEPVAEEHAEKRVEEPLSEAFVDLEPAAHVDSAASNLDVKPAAAAEPAATEAFVDLEPSAHVDAATAEFDVEPAASAEPSGTAAEAESLDMVDFDEFAPSMSAPAVAADTPMPDESYEEPVAQASDDSFELDAFSPSMSAPEVEAETSVPDEFYEESVAQPSDHSFAGDFEPEAHEVPQVEAQEAPHESADEPSEATASAEASVDAQSEFSPPPVAEPSRALFAERGFDSAANDDIGWKSTPSAAFSDLESAPEDWFDESVTAEAVEPAAESSAEATEEPAPVEMAATDHATDSWFDEVEGASTIESTDVSSDEFWLPPELPRMSAEEAAPPPDSEVPEQVTASVEAPDESYPSVTASAPHEETAPEAFEVDVEAEAAEDAVMVQHAEEVDVASAWSEPPAPLAAAPESFERDNAELTEEAGAYAAAESNVEATDYADAVIGHTPSFSEALQPPPAPFVTETLAELYLQQGFRDEALAIYRQLLEGAPDDQALKDRMAAIEGGQVASRSPDTPAEYRAASQSVRSFFSRLARRPAVTGGQGSASTPSEVTKPNPEVPFATAASALANLFAASKPPATDEGAASALAGAFTDPAGRPSRAAERELSLDHLFRDVPPGGSPGGSVSLDEFYATPNAAPGSPTEPGEVTGSEESGGTDIRQFTAWLEGLRKK